MGDRSVVDVGVVGARIAQVAGEGIVDAAVAVAAEGIARVGTEHGCGRAGLVSTITRSPVPVAVHPLVAVAANPPQAAEAVVKVTGQLPVASSALEGRTVGSRPAESDASP